MTTDQKLEKALRDIDAGIFGEGFYKIAIRGEYQVVGAEEGICLRGAGNSSVVIKRFENGRVRSVEEREIMVGETII